MPNNLKIDMNGSGLKIAIVSARFNEVVTRQLMLGAVDTLLITSYNSYLWFGFH